MPTTAAPAPQPDWVKICPEKDQCVVGRDLRADTGQTVASVALPLSGPQGKKALRVQLPVGLLLVPGVQVVVDQNQPVRGRYVICFPNSCFAEVPITDAFFNTMKKGTNLVVQAASNATDGGQQPKTLNFPIGLDGLSKAIDGAPIDPKVFEAEKQKMNSELQKRAAEAREKLQMQGQGSGAPGSAPGIGGQAPVQAQ
jgi:invasion protein IalB